MILKSLQKIKNNKATEIMIVSEWPWYPLFYQMSSEILKIKAKHNIYFSNRKDPFWNNVTLVAEILSGKPSN